MRSSARIVRADTEGAAAAAEVLRAGGVIVVPTDTVYGLAARPGDDGAVRTVYRIKGRPEGMHLPVLAGSLADVEALGVSLTAPAHALASRWWPGPLTLVLGFASGSERPSWLADREEVAVRVPDHDFVLSLLALTGALVATSANRHGTPTSREPEEVALALGNAVDLVVDGGLLTEVPSTLVNVAGPEPEVEREGVIGRHAIAATLAGRA